MIILIFIFLSNLAFAGSSEEVFTQIYDKKVWGTNEEGEGSSGAGSTAASTVEYRVFLQDFLISHGIKTVVDCGCGDWEFSQLIDWSGIEYYGVDAVQSVIQKNQQRFTDPNLLFMHGDILADPLPKADLLICKDVLMHLTNADIWIMLEKFRDYKYCLIANNVNPKKKNHDISRGDYRALDLTKPPFNIKADVVLTYMSDTLKQVILITNP